MQRLTHCIGIGEAGKQREEWGKISNSRKSLPFLGQRTEACLCRSYRDEEVSGGTTWGREEEIVWFSFPSIMESPISAYQLSPRRKAADKGIWEAVEKKNA